jgi:hypothetical protein
MKSSTDHSVPKLVVKTERVEQVMNIGFLDLAKKISLNLDRQGRERLDVKVEPQLYFSTLPSLC